MKYLPAQLAMAALIAISLNGCSPHPDGFGGFPPAADWTFQTAETSENLRDVFFINAGSGWAVGEKKVVISTTDGGQNWPLLPASDFSEDQDLRAAYFFDPTNGFVVGGKEEAPANGFIYFSQMGGAYPTAQKKVTNPLNTVFFLDENHGWVAGDSSILLHTENGGTSWTQSSIGTNRKILDIKFLNPQTGWAALNNGGIYRTKDGTTWIADESGVTSDIHAIQFLDTLHAWACGGGNTVLRRTVDVNNKPVWIPMTIDGEQFSTIWYDLQFISLQVGWITGTGGNVYKTTDGGLTWVQQSTQSSEDLFGIHMASATRGWVVGNKGVVMTYTPL